jgi:hypothetical protein
MASTHEVIRAAASNVEAAFLVASRARLDTAFHKINHCLEQLSDEEVWSRPRPEMNSIANILIHLGGNLRQWIISGVGGAADVRNRPAEFADRSGKPKAQLLKEFHDVIEQCDAVLAKTDPKSLLVMSRIQGFDVQRLAAIYYTISHLQGHVQEIIHMTRAIRGPEYRFDFIPIGKEQGGAEP